MILPGKRELCDRATQLLGDLGQTSDLLDLGLALIGLQSLDRALEEALVGGETAVLGDAVVVLAGEKTRSERRPDGGAVLVLVVEWSVLNLEALTVEGVVLRLLSDRSNEVVPVCVLVRSVNGCHCSETHFSAICVASMIWTADHSEVPQ
jgi:hypothetical protein